MAVDYYGRTVFEPSDTSNAGFMKRLGMIDEIGNQQNQIAQESAARQKQARQNAIDLRLQQAKTDSVNKGTQNQKNMTAAYKTKVAQVGTSPVTAAKNATKGGDFETFKNAIAKQESGSSYSARNSMSGAMGKYQIMPSNIAGAGKGWDYTALGYDVSPAQFMASPQIQEKVANHFLQGYYNKYGPAGAAVAWYAGPNAAKKYTAGAAAGTNGQAGGHPSVSSYIQQILDKMGL